MNETVMKGKWRQVKGSVKEQWGKLTDDDIKVFIGEGEQLVGKLQERYGYTKEQAEREVADFIDSLKEDSPLAEVRDRSTKVVREHPWSAGLFVAGLALLIGGFILNRIFPFEELWEDN
jgi:uncharacterized protein YjbJ (UPF0337 family)